MSRCGDCTACCTMYPIESINKPINSPCPNCDRGCLIWETKPQTCHDYECAYLQSENLPVELRPDKCGIIFDKKNDRIFTGTIVTGVAVKKIAKDQIRNFLQQGFSVILLKPEESPFVIPTQGSSGEKVYKEFKEVVNGNLQH